MTASAWMATPFAEAIGIEVPIVLAPLAGGPSTPGLAAAVSNAGGLGSLGVGYLSAGGIRREVDALRRLTDKPFAVNLFVDQASRVDSGEVERAWALLAPYRAELGLADAEPPKIFAEPFEDQLQAVIDARVPVVGFTFGIPDPAVVEAVRASGAQLLLTVTSLAEATAARAAGADFLCAQGAEAGGHRGTFIGETTDGLVGLIALVPQVIDATQLPVVAAGGIMDGRGIAAALALGAGAAQLGTAFLRCPEAGTNAAYRRALAASDGTTRLIAGISGKAARGLPNRLASDLASAEIPPYPIMHALTRDLRRRAAEQGKPELLSLWAGQGVTASRELSAVELMARLIAETEAAINVLESRA